MKRALFAVRLVFFALIAAIIISRTLSTGYSHDENQFVAAGELLVSNGLLPYVNYPYTHMPYAMALYGLLQKLTPFDFLAARLLSTLAWIGSLGVIVALCRIVSRARQGGSTMASDVLFSTWEFLIVGLLVYHPLAQTVPVLALNDSIATLFALLALLCFVLALQLASKSQTWPFATGLLVSLAAFSRFNYASLAVVLAILWLLHSLLTRANSWFAAQWRFWSGVLLGGLPALTLYALAPAAFYYGNLVYIRLNTLYYEGLLYRAGMDLGSKLMGFAQGLLHRPIDLLLLIVLLYVAITSFLGIFRRRSISHLAAFAAAGFAFVLLLTAFAPTPTFSHYFFAPLPFSVLLLSWLLRDLRRFGRVAEFAAIAAVLATFLFSARIQNPLTELSTLARPRDWTPFEVHDYALELRQLIPQGRVLSILPMFPLESGLDVYPFLANGPFSWRTSLLLTSERRRDYGVTSPEELPALLRSAPPVAIMTGFEAPNAGFRRQDLGGLEAPFADYAVAHGYRRVETKPRFLEHPIIVWIAPSP
jgi:hypothetical protein